MILIDTRPVLLEVLSPVPGLALSREAVLVAGGDMTQDLELASALVPFVSISGRNPDDGGVSETGRLRVDVLFLELIALASAGAGTTAEEAPPPAREDALSLESLPRRCLRGDLLNKDNLPDLLVPPSPQLRLLLVGDHSSGAFLVGLLAMLPLVASLSATSTCREAGEPRALLLLSFLLCFLWLPSELSDDFVVPISQSFGNTIGYRAQRFVHSLRRITLPGSSSVNKRTKMLFRRGRGSFQEACAAYETVILEKQKKIQDDDDDDDDVRCLLCFEHPGTPAPREITLCNFSAILSMPSRVQDVMPRATNDSAPAKF